MAGINNFLALMLQLSVPLVLGALCGTIAERGGIILLGVEGMMLLGAFAGVAGSFLTGSAFVGVLASILAGALFGWLYALFCLKWKAHQSVVGVGVTLFASGITAVLLKAIWHTGGMSDPVNAVSSITVPVLCDIPILGALFKDQSPYLYATLLIVAAVWVLFYKTKYGLRYRAIGDQPHAVQTAGVPVNRYRYIAMMAAARFSWGRHGIRGCTGCKVLPDRPCHPVPDRTDAALYHYAFDPSVCREKSKRARSTWQTGRLGLYYK